jgi:hypothetical protein
MNRFRLTSLILAATVAVALACKGMPAEFPAPDFTLKSPLTGKETTYAALKGRPVIIYWFTSW